MDGPEGSPPYAFLMSGGNTIGGIGEADEEMKARRLQLGRMWATMATAS
ncbi:MAG: hypothetical protein ACI8TQ_001578 [Planctomycetota bacterium]|jgi:hypothetical protein